MCAHLQFVIYSTRSKNSHLLKWGLAWSLRNPQKQPWVWCDQRTFTVTLWEALWGLVSTWGNRSLVALCGRSQRVERDCLCLNCYQKKKKKNAVIKTLIMPSCDYPGKTVLKSRAAIFFHHKLKTFKVIAIINCRIFIDQKNFFNLQFTICILLPQLNRWQKMWNPRWMIIKPSWDQSHIK